MLSNVLGVVWGAVGPWITIQQGGVRALGATAGRGSLM